MSHVNNFIIKYATPISIINIVEELLVTVSNVNFQLNIFYSNEYSTTMLPILTTPREVRSFDFIPVNIIREDSKDAYMPFEDRHFDDLSDVSLVPAGSSSRIQVNIYAYGKVIPASNPHLL